MKKLLLLFALTGLAIPGHIFAQYSVATLNGPWIAHSQGYNYVIFDGAGTITELGSKMDSVHPVGTYTVSPTGVIAATLYQTNGVVHITGNMVSDSAETFYVDSTQGPFQKYKVLDTLALEGIWNGYILDSVTNIPKTVQVVVNSGGTVVAATGIPLIAGKIFTVNGIFTGYITTTDADCNYRYIELSGMYAGDSLTGPVSLGKQTLGNGCTDNGRVHLTRSTTGITSINPENDFSVYPQPFSDELQIILTRPAVETQVALFDACSRKVYYKESGPTQNISLNDLNTLNSGLYLLMLTADSKTVVKRVIKN